MAAFTVKGKREPVEAWSVGAPLGSRATRGRRRALPARRPRRGARRARGARWPPRATGAGRLVEIAGEPGIGKTRLAEELRARAGGMTRLRVTCEAYTSATPYVAWRDLLRPLVGAAWEDPDSDRGRAPARGDPRARPGAGAVAAAARDPARRRPARRRPRSPSWRPSFRPRTPARGRRCASCAPGCPGPALIEIEDAHQMDAASADLLRALAAELDELPWLVVTARRDVRGGFVAPERRRRAAPHAARAARREAALALAEAATDSAPVPPHRLRDRRRALRRQPAAAARPAALGRRGRGDAAGLDRDRRARARRPARARRADARAPRRRARRHLPPAPPRRRARPGLPGARRRHVGPALRRDHGRWARATCASAAPSCATRRTPALPFALRRRLHAAVAARLATERNTSLDELAPALSLHYSRAGDTPEAWTYARLAAGPRGTAARVRRRRRAAAARAGGGARRSP